MDDDAMVRIVKELAGDAMLLGEFLVKLAGAITIPGRIEDFELQLEGGTPEHELDILFRVQERGGKR